MGSNDLVKFYSVVMYFELSCFLDVDKKHQGYKPLISRKILETEKNVKKKLKMFIEIVIK